jgi:hypothetical protein
MPSNEPGFLKWKNICSLQDNGWLTNGKCWLSALNNPENSGGKYSIKNGHTP